MLEQLAETVRTHRPDNLNQPFPDWLRREIVEGARPMLDDGCSLQAVAAAIGISTTSLYRWNRAFGEKKGFRPVVLQSEQTPGEPQTLQIRSPKGYVVSGLDLEEVAVLLGRLG